MTQTTTTRRQRQRTFGSVRKLPSGRYQVRYLTPSGERASAPTTFPTKADGNAYLASMQTQIYKGDWIDPRLARITFGAWVEEKWRPTITHFRPSTKTSYDYILRRFLIPAFGTLPLARLDTLAVRAWLADLHKPTPPVQAKPAATGTNNRKGTRRKTTLAPSTIAKAYKCLRAICNVAVEAGYLLRNPCTLKGAGAEKTAEMRHVSIPELHALAAAVEAKDRALILAAGYGGFRWGELAALRRGRIQVDTDRATGRVSARVQVCEQAVTVRGHIITGPPKTTAGNRTVTLPDVAARALAAHLEAFTGDGPDALVFAARNGTHLRHNHWYPRVWQPARTAVGLDGLRFHDLRHTAATLAAAAGATLKELMARLGHASPTVAMRYQHVMANREAAIAAALDGLATIAIQESTQQPAPTTATDRGTPHPAAGNSTETPGSRKGTARARTPRHRPAIPHSSPSTRQNTQPTATPGKLGRVWEGRSRLPSL